MEKASRALAEKSREDGKLDLDEGFIDGSFASAKKGASQWEKTKRGKGTKIMAIAAGNSIPVAVTIDSASPHESKLVDETLSGSFFDELMARLIGDKAYDVDPLDRHLEEEYGIEMITPQPGEPEPDAGRQSLAPL